MPLPVPSRFSESGCQITRLASIVALSCETLGVPAASVTAWLAISRDKGVFAAAEETAIPAVRKRSSFRAEMVCRLIDRWVVRPKPRQAGPIESFCSSTRHELYCWPNITMALALAVLLNLTVHINT